MRIEGPGRPAAPSAKSSARRANAAFTVAEADGGQAAEAASAPEAAAPLAPVSVPAPPDGAREADDRQAAEKGVALLDAMAGLQQALIGGDAETARARLAGLAQSTPSAADPRLDEVLKAVAQRAAVELARGQ